MTDTNPRTWDLTPTEPGYCGPKIVLTERPHGGVMVARADNPQVSPWILVPVTMLQYVDQECIRGNGDRDAAVTYNDTLDAAFPDGLPGGCGGYIDVPAEGRKYAINAEVRTPEWHGMSTIVGYVDRDPSAEHGITAVGPLYLVNEGNVFSDAYVAVYAESELEPFTAVELADGNASPF